MPKVVPEYKEEARRKIVQHASKLFSERGYSKTKMIDIAKSVGVSKGTIYLYFHSKSKLLISVLESYISLRKQEVRKHLGTKGIQFIATRELFERMLELRNRSPLSSPDILQEISSDKTVMKWIQDGIDRWIQGLKEMIDELVESGEISINVPSEHLARGILALRDGLYSQLSLGAEVEQVTDAWVEIMGILMKQVLT